MSESRWSWNWSLNVRNCLPYTRSPTCNVVYSVGSGCSVAASILYVGKGLTSCFSPMVAGVLACVGFTGTTAIKYRQLTENDDRLSELERKEERNEERIRTLETKVENLGNDYNDAIFGVAQALAALDQIALIMGEDIDQRNRLYNQLLKILAPSQQGRDEVLVTQILETLNQIVLNMEKDIDQRNRLYNQLLKILAPPQQGRDGVLVRVAPGTNLGTELKQADSNRYRWFTAQPISPVSSDSGSGHALGMNLDELSEELSRGNNLDQELEDPSQSLLGHGHTS